jgi:cell wall-associated NlpC family hydrolase
VAGTPSTGTVVRAVPAAQVRAASPTLAVGSNAWVSVSVARLWLSPKAPWSVDAPALTAPVHFRTWLRAMTLSQRRNLDLRSDTEALLGDRVVVVRLRRHWAKVVVPSQPSQKDARGYPGWIPRRQLTATAPRSSTQVATVVSRTAWLRTDDDTPAHTVRISFGTNLPVVGQAPGYVRVATPKGAVRRLRTTTVSVHAKGAAAIAPSRSSLVSTAKKFLGVPYLWGGLSGFGLDCSGLTWLDHRAHGIRIPRDALPQSQHGGTDTSRLPGDLLFYANDSGRVHHVTLYVGDGQIIQAPHTGAVVRIDDFSDQPLRSEYVGARRYLD